MTSEDCARQTSPSSERFIQEKVAAFVEIAASLGARQLVLVSASIDRRSAAGGASLSAAAAQAGLSAAFKDDNTIERQVMMEFPEPEREPEVPEHLGAWLMHDPILRAFANTRLRQRLSRAAVSLHMAESVALAAELAVMLPKQGIKVGGEYRRVHDSTWAFEVEFWPNHAGRPTS
jgi:hypothetical protein